KQQIKEREGLERAFGCPISFLGRRCYENYLLHPSGISAVLNTTASFKAAPSNEAVVADWMSAHAGEAKYGAAEHEPFSAEWLKAVDASRLLDDLFQGLSEAKEIYRKPLHSVEITRWLLSSDPHVLSDLIEYVEGLIRVP